MSLSDLISEVKNFIASRLRSREDLRVGLEVENLIYDQKMNRIPVNSGTTFSTSDLKARLEEKIQKRGLPLLSPWNRVVR